MESIIEELEEKLLHEEKEDTKESLPEKVVTEPPVEEKSVEQLPIEEKKTEAPVEEKSVEQLPIEEKQSNVNFNDIVVQVESLPETKQDNLVVSSEEKEVENKDLDNKFVSVNVSEEKEVSPVKETTEVPVKRSCLSVFLCCAKK